MTVYSTPERGPEYWVPCEAGPFFLQGYPCCPGHARERADSGDLGWWTDTTNWPPMAPGFRDVKAEADELNLGAIHKSEEGPKRAECDYPDCGDATGCKQDRCPWDMDPRFR